MVESASINYEVLEKTLGRFRQESIRKIKFPSMSTLLKDCLPRLFIFLIGYLGIILGSFPYCIISAVIGACGAVSLVGSWFHECIHINPKKRTTLQRIIARVSSAPIAASPAWWYYKHTLLHHRFTSRPDNDPDIQFGWLLRVVPTQQWHPTHRFQHLYAWVLYPFSVLNMIKPTELYQSKMMHDRTGVKLGTSLPACMLDKYLPFLVFWSPVVVFNTSNALFAFIVFILVAGLLTSLITQVQHNTELTLSNASIPYEYPLSRNLLLSCDVGGKRNFWWWLCGGVSFHSAHHIIPSLTFLDSPWITTELNEYLGAWGISVPTHKSIFSAFSSHHRLLKSLSTKPIESTNQS